MSRRHMYLLYCYIVALHMGRNNKANQKVLKDIEKSQSM